MKNLLINIYKVTVNVYYSVLTLFRKTDHRKVVFVLSRAGELEGNLLYFYNELSKQLEGAKIHFVLSKNKMNLKLFYEVTLLSNARYLIIDDYYLPIYLIRPSRHLKVVQLWHAAGAFKKFGYSTIGTKFGPNDNYLRSIPIHSNYSHVYVSSKKIVPYYAEAFNMPEKNIFPLGIPRIDLFNDKKRMEDIVNNVTKQYPILKNKNTVKILIAPTYRAKGNHQETGYNVIDIIDGLLERINKNVYLILSLHPYMPMHELEALKNKSNIIIGTDRTINEWMVVVDAFITDYSSAIFDFSLLNKPFAHFVPDIAQYKRNRGFYEDIETISDGQIITEPYDLYNWINSRVRGEYFDTDRMIGYNFDNTHDVSKRVVSHLLSTTKEV